MTTTKPTGVVARLTAELNAAQEATATYQEANKELAYRVAKNEALLKAHEVSWQNRLDDMDSEARAIAGCVAAIEEMRHPKGATYGGTSSMLYGYSLKRFDPQTGQPYPEPPPPPIGSTDVGRILLHLAARYGVDLGGAS
jgi:hypothetical protein